MATTAKPKKKREPRAKKQFLPGMEPPSHKDIDAAADNYYEVMMERVKLSKDEAEAMQALIDKMNQHGIDRYECPHGLVVTVISKLKCKVKKKKDVESNGDGEPEEA